MANFTAFSVQVNDQTYVGTLVGNDVNIDIPFGVDRSAMVVTFTLSAVAVVNITGVAFASGSTLDLTNPVTFTIVEVAQPDVVSIVTTSVLPNTEALIKSFNIAAPVASIGVIRDTIGTVVLIVPEGSVVTALEPTITLSEHAAIVPATNVAQNFTNSVVYTVTAQDGVTTKIYNVSVLNMPNHNNDSLTIYRMLRNRLPFIKDTENNKQLLSELTLEIMWELEGCLKASDPGTGILDNSRIGQEMYYNIPQKSVVADMLAVRLLVQQSIKSSSGYVDETGAAVASEKTFIKEGMAGSAKVVFDQFDVNTQAVSSLAMTSTLSNLQSEVVRKLRAFGCDYKIADDGLLYANDTDDISLIPRIVLWPKD